MFTLDQVVPWGRSFDEYVRMLALSDVDLQKTMLGFALGKTQRRYVDAGLPALPFLEARGFHVTLPTVPYEFQRGGNQTMRIRPSSRQA